MNKNYGGYILQKGDNDHKGIYGGDKIGKNLGYVKELQEDLLTLGYLLPKYGADGDFGIETQETVILFQKNLVFDGKIDELTAIKIKEFKKKQKKYQIKFYKGDYSTRQQSANNDKAICYYEQHFNSYSETSSGIEILIPENASDTTRKWATLLAKKYYEILGTQLRHGNGVVEVKRGSRGYWNLARANMPAILGEPLFVSNPQEVILLKKNITNLASAISSSIKEIFPKGGLVAFSVGHKYKKTSPNDKGASVIGETKFEADYAEEVLLTAEKQF